MPVPAMSCVLCADHSGTAYTYCRKPDAQQTNAAGAAAPAVVMNGMPAPGTMPGPGTSAPNGQAGPSGQPVYKMIVARVALGNQTVGAAGMRRPPDGFDSVNSGQHGKALVNLQSQAGLYCHVVFDNDQCYPEYLVTLTQG